MQNIQQILNNPIYDLLLGVALVSLVWNASLQIQIFRTKKRLAALFDGAQAKDFEGLISEQIKRLRQTEKGLKELNEFAKKIEQMALNSVQKVGVIRFNPFKDTGGDQSFCIAFLDAHNNGFTLSSLFTRDGARIYTKPIKHGQSAYPLTEEELRAIEEAIAKNQKPKIKN